MRLDQGARGPLQLIFPQADVPVVPVRVDQARDARQHVALGRALAGFGESDALVLASGSPTHTLRDLGPAPGDTASALCIPEFEEWVRQR